MKHRVLTAILYLVAVCGCEQEITDPDWPPYVEKLVIVGSIEVVDDTLQLHCAVSRTVPLHRVYSEEETSVKDAAVSVQCGGTEYIADYNDGGSYRTRLPRLGARAVELRVRHGSKYARSIVPLPDPPPFDTLGVTVTPEGDTTLFARIYPSDPRSKYALVADNRFPGTQQRWKQARFVRDADAGTGVWYAACTVNGIGGGAFCRVVMTSSAEEDFARARSDWLWRGEEDPFDNNSGKNPPFSIAGDGIGFFWSVVYGPATEIRWR